MSGHGELAAISDGRLVLVGAPDGHLHIGSVSGRVPTDLAWSPDGRYLAVQMATVPPSTAPYLTDRHPSVVILDRDGRRTGPVLSHDDGGVHLVGWSPTSDRLAVVTDGPQRRSQVSVVGVDVPTRVVATLSGVGEVAWSPRGSELAVSAASFSHQHYLSTLAVYPSSGGAGRVLDTSHESVWDLAGWWPDGSGLLAWLDPQGSGSIAADGLPLYDVSTGGRRLVVPSMLVHSSWIATSAQRDEIAVVSGGDRELAEGHKTVAVCSVAGCQRLAQPAGDISLDPAWTSAGQLTDVRERALSPTTGFGPGYVARLAASGRVRSSAGAGLAPAGSTSPQWASDGALLYVRDNAVWLETPGHGQPVRVLSPVTPDAEATYYAFWPWLTQVAWSDALPGDIAGRD